MKTQILDCDIILNSKKIPIINSDMKIELEWDIETEKNEESASVKIILKSLRGYVNFASAQTFYRKTTKIEFNTDSSWSIKSKHETIDYTKIEPVYSLIDFDSRMVNIEY